jgi:hypothetical protein
LIFIHHPSATVTLGPDDSGGYTSVDQGLRGRLNEWIGAADEHIPWLLPATHQNFAHHRRINPTGIVDRTMGVRI